MKMKPLNQFMSEQSDELLKRYGEKAISSRDWHGQLARSKKEKGMAQDDVDYHQGISDRRERGIDLLNKKIMRLRVKRKNS